MRIFDWQAFEVDDGVEITEKIDISMPVPRKELRPTSAVDGRAVSDRTGRSGPALLDLDVRNLGIAAFQP